MVCIFSTGGLNVNVIKFCLILGSSISIILNQLKYLLSDILNNFSARPIISEALSQLSSTIHKMIKNVPVPPSGSLA